MFCKLGNVNSPLRGELFCQLNKPGNKTEGKNLQKNLRL